MSFTLTMIMSNCLFPPHNCNRGSTLPLLSVGKRKLFRHISEVHNVNPTCDQCDKVLTDCDAMMKHIKCHTMAAVIRPSCARCFRKFKRDKNEQSDVCRNCLKQNQKHIAQKSLNLEPVITNDVSVKLQLKCDKCHEEFVDKNGLKKHMKYKHRKERTGGEMYRCQHCLLENKQKNVNSISFFRYNSFSRKGPRNIDFQ